MSSFKSTVINSTIPTVGSYMPMRTFWSLFIVCTAGRVDFSRVSQGQCASNRLRFWTHVRAAAEDPPYDLMDPQPGNLVLKFYMSI